MKRRNSSLLFVFLGFLLLATVNCMGQQQVKKPQMYYIYIGNNNQLFQKMKNLGFKRIQAMHGKYIDPDKDGKINRDVFINYVTQLFPHKNDTGMLALDWEGKGISDVLRRSDIHSTEFKSVTSEMTKLIKLLHKNRPNVLVGFYGLPIRRRASFDEEYIDRIQALAPIFKEEDIIYPSLYDMGKGSPKKSYKDGDLYIEKNTRLALKLGEKYDCKVIPYVWHRYYPSIKRFGMSLVPKEEFTVSLHDILKTTYQNKSVDGIVWWRSDNLFYRWKREKIVEDAQKRGGLQKSIEANTLSYSKSFKKAFKYKK